jgi:hypothetical protein
MTRSISNTAKHRLAPLSVLCLLGTTISLSAGPDYSDEYTQAFINRFGTICMADLKAVCPDALYGIEKEACLAGNLDKLTPECGTAFEPYSQKLDAQPVQDPDPPLVAPPKVFN